MRRWEPSLANCQGRKAKLGSDQKPPSLREVASAIADAGGSSPAYAYQEY